MTREIRFAPSLLSADPLNVQSAVESLEGEHDWLHVDIMDALRAQHNLRTCGSCPP